MGSYSEGTWSARLMDEASGKQVYKPLGDFAELPPSMRFDAAMEKAREWFQHLVRGGSHEEFSVRDACTRYVEKTRRERGAAPAKDIEQRFTRRVFNNTKLSATPLTKLTPSALESWKAANLAAPAMSGKQKGKPRSPSSFNRDMACLKAALNLAFLDGLITSDFAWKSKLTSIKNATSRRTVYLDRPQRQRLLDACPSDLKNLVRAACLLPLRSGAIAALTVADFDSRLTTLSVGKDKHGHQRKIPLPSETAGFLGEMANNKLPTAPLFSRADGSFWGKDAWKNAFKQSVRQAGLPSETVLYNLRHTVITDLIHSGLDILTVAQFSGTSVVMIEKYYGHITRQHGRTALGTLAI